MQKKKQKCKKKAEMQEKSRKCTFDFKINAKKGHKCKKRAENTFSISKFIQKNIKKGKKKAYYRFFFSADDYYCYQLYYTASSFFSSFFDNFVFFFRFCLSFFPHFLTLFSLILNNKNLKKDGKF